MGPGLSDLLTTSDAARLLVVSPDTIRRLERQGRLAAQRTSSGQRIFHRHDVEVLRAIRQVMRRKGAAL